jgi:hypothetical protein
MLISLMLGEALLVGALSGLLTSVAVAQDKPAGTPSESNPVIIIYPAPDPAPAPPTPVEVGPSVWHRLDLRAAQWRDGLADVQRRVRDRVSAVIESDVVTCVATTLGIAGQVLQGLRLR